MSEIKQNQPCQIKDLKKHYVFKFGSYKYVVTKKYRNDDSPLKAIDEMNNEQLFHNEELEVIFISKWPGLELYPFNK